MNWELILVSKPNFSETRELISRYEKRLYRYITLETIYFKDCARLESHMAKHLAFTILLDLKGTQFSSETLAKSIEIWRETSKNIRFCVGDSFGFPDELRKKANLLWKLSELTLPSDFAWLLLWEQVFRAFSILKKTGYHHGVQGQFQSSSSS